MIELVKLKIISFERIIMCEQTVGYSYEVEYGDYSSNSSSYHPDECRFFVDAEEAKEFGLQEVTRLAGLGENVKNLTIEQFCLNCDGTGKIYIPYKRIKYKKQEKKCPVCKGKNSTVKIF